MTMGEKIKWLRHVKGWSQEDLAKMMGYQDRSIISLVESDKREVFAGSIIKYAELFGVTPLYLLGWENGFDDNEMRLLEYVAQNEHTKQMLMDYAMKLKDVVK